MSSTDKPADTNAADTKDEEDTKADDTKKPDAMSLDVGCAEGSVGNTLIYVLMAMTIIFVLLFIIFMVLYLFSRSTVAKLDGQIKSNAAVGGFAAAAAKAAAIEEAKK